MRSEREFYEAVLERGRQHLEDSFHRSDTREVQFYSDVAEWGFEAAVLIARDECVKAAYAAMGTPMSCRYSYLGKLMDCRHQREGGYASHEEYLTGAHRILKNALLLDEVGLRNMRTGRLYREEASDAE